ncbi:Hypothetical predicted protein [Octopus vulgaris]|uniref:Uncharacterized protein n=1 Tax=Octopus vulgaris TaxID=6645 RepID=A0AA36EWN1_OCTVU|nr:Hypothetical predicted protein [Octopus vulgaris]
MHRISMSHTLVGIGVSYTVVSTGTDVPYFGHPVDIDDVTLVNSGDLTDLDVPVNFSKEDSADIFLVPFTFVPIVTDSCGDAAVVFSFL